MGAAVTIRLLGLLRPHPLEQAGRIRLALISHIRHAEKVTGAADRRTCCSKNASQSVGQLGLMSPARVRSAYMSGLSAIARQGVTPASTSAFSVPPVGLEPTLCGF